MTRHPAAPGRRPLYARVLRLRHLSLSALWCFLLFEGVLALAVVLALAEFVSWWGLVLLPLAVAAMVKLNDLVAGLLRGAPARRVTRTDTST